MKTDPVTSWCTCTKCKDDSLMGSREFRCCREVAEAYGKVKTSDNVVTLSFPTKTENVHPVES